MKENIVAELFSLLYEKDPQNFEQVIFAALIHDKFDKRIRLRVCSSNENGSVNRDFSSRIRTGLYLAFRMFLEVQEESEKGSIELGWGIIQSLCLIVIQRHPEILKEDDMEELQTEWEEITQTSEVAMKNIAINGMVEAWLSFTRLRKEYNLAQAAGSLRREPKAFLKRLQKKVEEVSASAEKKEITIYEWDQVPLHTENAGERISSNMPTLDRCLGGGFIRQHSYLFIATTGGGKTTFTTQMAANFCILQDLGGIWITTEDPVHSLRQRLVSHCCRIEWEKIRSDKDAILPNKMTPTQAKQYKDMNEALSRNLMIVDWTMDENMTENFDELVEEFHDRKGKKPDFILFDWLGGALEHSAAGSTIHNQGELRHVYSAAAQSLKNVSMKHDLICIFNVQTNRGAAKSAFVGTEDIGESYAVAHKVGGVIGMSSLRDTDSGCKEGNQLYKEDQMLFVSKSRHGPGGQVLFKRRFEFQRLEPMTA